MNDKFVKVDGSNFTVNNEKIIFRGYGIGNWLNIEHFMIGLPGSESQIRSAIENSYGKNKANQFWEKYYNCYINEKDFQFLKNIGVNSVRISFNYHHFESDQNPYYYHKSGFEQIDRILNLCEKYCIFAILDLHSAPGGQNPDWHSDNAIGECLFWKYRDFQKRVIALWSYIAEYYRENHWIAAYDLLNEPTYYEPKGKMIDSFYQELIGKIREVDPNHLFFIEGDFYGHRFKEFEPCPDPNVAYSIHFYPTFSIEDYKEDSTRVKKLNDALLIHCDVNEIKTRLKRPIWCGETGISSRRGNIPLYESILRDCISVLEKHHISWSIWCYKDARSMGSLRPKDNSLWMKFSRQACGNWEFSEEFDQYLKSSKVIENMYSEGLPTEVQRKLTFRLLANNQLVLCCNYPNIFAKIPFEEFLKYPDSFLFDNCEKWPAIIDIITNFSM